MDRKCSKYDKTVKMSEPTTPITQAAIVALVRDNCIETSTASRTMARETWMKCPTWPGTRSVCHLFDYWYQLTSLMRQRVAESTTIGRLRSTHVRQRARQMAMPSGEMNRIVSSKSKVKSKSVPQPCTRGPKTFSTPIEQDIGPAMATCDAARLDVIRGTQMAPPVGRTCRRSTHHYLR